MARDIDDTRLSLVAASKSAVADYYVAEKSTGVAQENVKLLREFRQNAETRYRTGVGPQQDMLQAGDRGRSSAATSRSRSRGRRAGSADDHFALMV